MNTLLSFTLLIATAIGAEAITHGVRSHLDGQPKGKLIAISGIVFIAASVTAIKIYAEL